MNNENKIENIIGGLEGVFYPKVAYRGTYYIPLKVFLDSSIAKNGLNAAEEYFEKKYRNIIVDAFNSLSPPIPIYKLFIKSELNEENKRVISLDPSLVFIELANKEFKCNLSPELVNDKEALEKEYIETLKDLRRRAREIAKGNLKIEDDKQIYAIYLDVSEKAKKDFKNTLEKLNKDVKIKNLGSARFKSEAFLRDFVPCLTDSIHAYKFLNEALLKSPINLDEISKCIDYNAFYLVYARYCLNECKKEYKKNNKVSYLAVFLNEYVKVISQLQKEIHYDIQIRFADNNPKVIKGIYSYKNFLEDYKRNQEVITNEEIEYYKRINPNGGNDYTILDNVEKEIERLKIKSETEVLLANWEFFPAVKNNDNINNSSNSSEEKREATETLEKEEQDIVDLTYVLENTDYSYQIYGKDKFEGYKGYLYPNGYIIFERLSIIDGTLKRIPNNATYVMQLSNFKEMSKLPKPQIIDYIKSGASGVKRIYHTNSWEQNILQVGNFPSYFDSSLYTDGILAEIKRLTAIGELIEDKEKSTSLKLSNN